MDDKRADRIAAALERMATAQEELNALAKDERDDGDLIERLPSPPFCPHCGYFDPRVETNSGGEGRMSEFVLVANCQECNQQFYAMADGFEIAKTLEGAIAMREDRKGGTDGTDKG